MKEVALLYFSKSNTRQVKVSFIFTEHWFSQQAYIFFSCKGCVSYYLKSTEKINVLGCFLITEHIC